MEEKKLNSGNGGSGFQLTDMFYLNRSQPAGKSYTGMTSDQRNYIFVQNNNFISVYDIHTLLPKFADLVIASDPLIYFCSDIILLTDTNGNSLNSTLSMCKVAITNQKQQQKQLKTGEQNYKFKGIFASYQEASGGSKIGEITLTGLEEFSGMATYYNKLLFVLDKTDLSDASDVGCLRVYEIAAGETEASWLFKLK